MKWKKENNIKSLNDPSVKIDSNVDLNNTTRSSDQLDESFASSTPNSKHHHQNHKQQTINANSGANSIAKLEFDRSIKSDDDENLDD